MTPKAAARERHPVLGWNPSRHGWLNHGIQLPWVGASIWRGARTQHLPHPTTPPAGLPADHQPAPTCQPRECATLKVDPVSPTELPELKLFGTEMSCLNLWIVSKINNCYGTLFSGGLWGSHR